MTTTTTCKTNLISLGCPTSLAVLIEELKLTTLKQMFSWKTPLENIFRE